MLTLLSNSFSKFAVPQMHLMHQSTVQTFQLLQMEPYLEGGCCPSNPFDSFTEEYPMCSLSGRIKVLSCTIGSEAFHNFVGNNEPEMSIDQEQIDELARNINKANYPSKIIFNKEMPQRALAAFAQGKISIWDISNVLLWHQFAKDYPDCGLTILPLFDDEGNWTNEAYNELLFSKLSNYVPDDHPFNSFFYGKLELLRTLIRQLPPSQQVWRKSRLTWSDFEGKLIRNVEFSFEAWRVFLYVQSNRHFTLEPRLGNFTKNDIVNAEIDKRSRPCNIPFPGITTVNTLNKNIVSPSVFSGHDQLHGLLMHIYSPELVDALREILLEFRKTIGELISSEIWGIGDFAFINLRKQSNLEKDPTLEFDKAISAVLSSSGYFDDPKNLIFDWYIVLHMRAHHERWLTQYGISIEKIHGGHRREILGQVHHSSKLYFINQLVKLAEPFLNDYSTIEKIYLLKKLKEYGSKLKKATYETFFLPELSVKEVRDFFQTPLILPILKIEVIDDKLQLKEIVNR